MLQLFRDRKTLTKILSFFAGLALLISWLLPNHYFPWATASSEFAAFFAALLMLPLILTKPIQVNKTVALFVLLATIPLIQYATGIIYFWGDALIASAYLLGLATMILVGHNLASNKEMTVNAYRMLAYLFIAGSILSVGLALTQWLILTGNVYWIADMPPDGRPFANLGQPNMLASLLCMGIASTIYLFEKRRISLFTAAILGVYLLFGVALTQSRTPWLGAIFVLVWWAWKARDLSPRLSVKAILGWIGVYAIFVISIPSISGFLGGAVAHLRESDSSLERLQIWQQLGTAVLNGPLWGYGWNQVSVAQITIANLVPSISQTEHSHNILLDLIVWNGPILGGLLIIVIATWLLRMAWRLRSMDSVFGMMAVGFLLIHAMLEFPLEYAYFLLPAGLIIGMVETDQLPSRTLTLPRPIFALIIVAAGFGYATIWQEYRLIEDDSRLLRFEMAHVGTLRAKQAAPDVKELTQLREYTRMARTPPTNHMTTAQLEQLHQVALRFPTKLALYRYNLALALNHQPNAQLELDRTQGMYGSKVYQQTMKQLAEDTAGQ
jgi:hypothetical protein